MELQDTASNISPPGNGVEAPLAPAQPSNRVARILELLRNRMDGRDVPETPWLTLRLLPSEHDELDRLINDDESLWAFTETKLSYDYNSRTSTCVIRLPTLLHSVFIARVVEQIKDRLRAIADGKSETPSRSFAAKVEFHGSATLVFQSADDAGSQAIIRHEPDAQFTHKNAPWPGVIIEVSYSQKTRAVPHLADDYILESNGSIRAVVGLDLDHKTKKATMTISRPQYILNRQGELVFVAAQAEHQVFRDELGNPNLTEDSGLRLELRDFAPPALTTDVTDSFLIDSATLCRCLHQAEERERIITEKWGPLRFYHKV